MYADGLNHALREKNVRGWCGDGDGCDGDGDRWDGDGVGMGITSCPRAALQGMLC